MPSIAEKRKQKRTAPSEPRAKKARLDTSSKSEEKGKKRSRPVTAPVKESDESDEELDEEAWQDEPESAEGDEVAEGDEEGAPKVKDPNAARESHKAQKALHTQRKAAKPHSELLTEAKRAWSLARQKDLKKAERTKHIAALMEVLRGRVKDIVFKHDASRIVQTVVKYGSASERNEIAEELKGRYRELAQNKYSKFLVTKLIRLCPTHRASILQEFQGSVMRLLLHREASSVLADSFELYANAYERALLLKDFYGKEAQLFTVTLGSDEERERSKKGLRGVLEGADKERRRRILNAVKENLTTVFNNSDKGAVSHAIVHRVLWEYLSVVNESDDEAEKEKQRREMFETCQDVLAEMVHTKDGSRVVREFIAQGTAKDRKHIVKAIKPHVERMCTDDEAQLVLFTALDVIDDTKLTAKSLVADIVASAHTLYQSSQGRRSLIYLVSPRTRRHFTPAQIALLAETDPIRAQTSKKDESVRTDEIRKAASEPLLAWVAEKGAEVARDPGGSLVVGEVLLYADGDKAAASATLLRALAEPYPAPDPAAPHIIALAHASRLYKTLLQGGPFDHKAGAVARAPLWDALAFARAFVQTVGRENTCAIARDDGAFVVAVLCERAQEDEALRTELRGWFEGAVRKELEGEKERRGRSVLLEQIAAL
ncbi:Pumilio and CPL domain-containing protein [Phanerochaete sordida]|uniref:Pumilio and CPL domain-containing protein n=1 Tax=Phanerochaete sordida TaxID=48140 RepID=A0A9P3GEL3_9APHY|nr:Pumilio and CPL domain-containing protein [Phanerochaete sordida]